MPKKTQGAFNWPADQRNFLKDKKTVSSCIQIVCDTMNIVLNIW